MIWIKLYPLKQLSLLSFLLFFNFQGAAQNFSLPDCKADPSCRQTKAMLLKTVQLWDSLSPGINYNSRSDSIDVLQYTLDLDLTEIMNKQLEGSCKIRFKPLMAKITSITLDLLQLQVDSILSEMPLRYSYNDTLLQCFFSEPLLPHQMYELTVYYRGKPVQDSYWGGFYVKDNYAYNMGVGFVSDPHNYGRVWHPCFDNFKEKASYTFKIKTKDQQRAHCNGRLLSERVFDGFNSRVWELKESIPTYLACIAVGDYTTIQKKHQGKYKKIPIELAAASTDTARLNKSFKHLPQAIDAYEYWFGPHRWSKVGYTLVPFHSGAMEHATNIAYPIYAADGTLQRESLMAHELGHSWWGNLVTCASAKDMWINEGMASYAVHLFTEYTYGRAQYLKTVQQNHYQVLRRAHLSEKGYRPIAEVPHQYTYGMHVYDKGASVVHNLRAYMGDSLFRVGLQHITQNYAFKNINTLEFRDALAYASGIDLDAFFEDWLYLGGFPHFEIDHYLIDSSTSNYQIQVFIRQKLVGRSKMLQDVPLELSFFGPSNQKIIGTLNLSSVLDSQQFELPFLPHAVLLNEGHRLNQARFDYRIAVPAKCQQTALKLPSSSGLSDVWLRSSIDTASIHVAYHPVAPSSRLLKDTWRLSSRHYWSFNGDFPVNTDIYASLTSQLKVDTELMRTADSMDSLLLLYRPNVNESWQIHPDYYKRKGFKSCIFRFSLLPGDYAFGRSKIVAKFPEPVARVFEEPIVYQCFDKRIQVSLNATTRTKACLELYHVSSKRVLQQCVLLQTKSKKFDIPTLGLEPGVYFIKLRSVEGRLLQSQKIYISNN